MSLTAAQADPLEAALLQLERDVTEIIKPGKKKWATVCDEIDNAADNVVNQILATVTSDVGRYVLRERVKHLRTLGAGKGTSADDNLIRTCQILLGFSLAAVTFLLTFSEHIRTLPITIAKLLVAIGLSFGVVLFTSLFVLVVHTIQNRFRYPFLYFEKIGNPWNWFYYGCISPDTPRWPFVWPKRLRFKGAKLYAVDLARFVRNAVKEDKAAALRSDLQHFFLMMSYQGYGLQFELRNQNWFVYGVGAALFGLVLLVGGVVSGVL